MTDSFSRRELGGLPFYVCRALELPHVRHAFSTRHGGCSPLPEAALNLGAVAWDDIAAVKENRRRFLSAAGLGPFPLATLSQIHSDRIHIIKDLPREENARPQGDGLMTALNGVTLAVQVADCFPVLIAGEHAVAAVHAGWRGAALRIVARTVECMRREFGTDPAGVSVAIGPGIRACCFEVGPEVLARFDAEFPGLDLHKHALLDLPRALAAQLADIGVPEANVQDIGLCTRCNPGEFFSYRGEGARTGRMMGVIAMEHGSHRPGNRELRGFGGG
jgi:YfiH family protein